MFFFLFSLCVHIYPKQLPRQIHTHTHNRFVTIQGNVFPSTPTHFTKTKQKTNTTQPDPVFLELIFLKNKIIPKLHTLSLISGALKQKGNKKFMATFFLSNKKKIHTPFLLLSLFTSFTFSYLRTNQKKTGTQKHEILSFLNPIVCHLTCFFFSYSRSGTRHSSVGERQSKLEKVFCYDK